MLREKLATVLDYEEDRDEVIAIFKEMLDTMELPTMRVGERFDSEYNYKYFVFGEVVEDAQQDLLKAIKKEMGGKDA